MYKNVKVMAKLTKKPLSIWPNAGLPQMIDGKTVFPATPKEMAKYAKKFWKLGVNIIGGCCGSNKEHIKAIADKVKGKKTKKRKVKETSYLCSRTKTLEIDKETLIVGERINPTGRKEFREEIKQGKTALIRTEALQQVKEGAELLDINVGVAGINETEMLKKAVSLVQSTVNVPIVIDTSDVKALEESLKLSDGKALINSVNGKEDSLNTVLALAKKYGAAIIGLTLDKEGIPKTKEKRLKIAKKIIKRALEIGIDKNDIYIDCLTMTIATNPENEKILLDCVKEIKAMGYKTILGVSNISHGLPNRSLINSKFYTKASKAGLNLAILNPLDKTKQKKTDIQDFAKVKIEKKDYSKLPLEKQLYNAILYGDEDGIAAIVDKALASMKALQINEILVSALSEVGDKFKCKEYFLPNVLLSASTMKKAFSRLKEEFKKTGQKHKAKVLFATVKDDVHDIGKNIVIALIESNNYQVVDLGKDVSTEAIIEAVKKHKIDIVCLSALMTTTAPYMKEVIKKLDIEKIKIPVLIGGAVITEDYAKGIGAFYAKDAISAVKKLGEIIDHN